MTIMETDLKNPGVDTNMPTLFDQYGRRNPDGIKAAVHRNIRRYFLCKQPAIDYSAIHGRLTRHLKIDNPISAQEFEQRAEAILAGLRSDPLTANLCLGVGVPFLLPKAEYADLGTAFEKTYLAATEQAFGEVFPEYQFVNHNKDDLKTKFGVAPGSRQQRLLQAMQADQVVGYFFPALSEYSVPAAIEQMDGLPESFLLAAGFDTAAAFIGSPDLLLRTDGYPPLLWLAGWQVETAQVGYHFEAYGYNLTFNRRVHFNQAAESWASGLVVIG